MKTKIYVILAIVVVALSSCQEKSLQKYLVEKQDDPHFLKLDISPGLVDGFKSEMSDENKEILNTIKKVNLVAYQIQEGNTADYNKEKEEVKRILKQEKYKDLTRINSNQWSAQFLYTGSETAIDEVIVFASDDEKGFAIARLLGNKMRPDHLLKLIQATEKGDVDISALGDVLSIFQN